MSRGVEGPKVQEVRVFWRNNVWILNASVAPTMDPNGLERVRIYSFRKLGERESQIFTDPDWTPSGPNDHATAGSIMSREEREELYDLVRAAWR